MTGCDNETPPVESGQLQRLSSSTTTANPVDDSGASAEAAPPAPNNPSTLEEAAGSPPPNLLLDDTGRGPGDSDEFTPTGAKGSSQQSPGSTGLVRLRVEWACADGVSLEAVLEDQSGESSSQVENCFDDPIPVSDPPAFVTFPGDAACSWHVRALDQ